MKLATERSGMPDGRLLIVARDLSRVTSADHIVPNLLAALERWTEVLPDLEELSEQLNSGQLTDARPYDPSRLLAPLPRTWQWLDGSAYPTHGQLMQRAYKLPPIPSDPPLMYQGMSHRFLSPTDVARFPDVSDGIDFEGELGAITSEVPMGVTREQALQTIRLLVQINDWSLRVLGAAEMKTGFGWVTAKPACSMAPVAVTPDELGSAWIDGRVHGTLEVRLNGDAFGDVEASPMEFGFHELISHAAMTRDLCAGTIIGSGTLSSPNYAAQGSCCIAERRAIETIAEGQPRTPFLSNGDRVEMTTHVDGVGALPFGTIDQLVSVPH
jgi:fumarylacetoacetate (FAA) hydrolase